MTHLQLSLGYFSVKLPDAADTSVSLGHSVFYVVWLVRERLEGALNSAQTAFFPPNTGLAVQLAEDPPFSRFM